MKLANSGVERVLDKVWTERFGWSVKGVVSCHAAEFLAVPKVFGVEAGALRLLGGGDDQAVVPTEAVALLGADGFADKRDGGVDRQHGAEDGGQEELRILVAHLVRGLYQSEVEELLDDLIADYTGAICADIFDEVERQRLLAWVAIIIAIDKDIGVQKHLTAHSALPGCTCVRPLHSSCAP